MNYSWPVSNTGVRSINLLPRWKSDHNFLLSEHFSRSSGTQGTGSRTPTDTQIFGCSSLLYKMAQNAAYSQPALCICRFPTMDWKYCFWSMAGWIWGCETGIWRADSIFTEKNLHRSRSAQFRPVLFKAQLWFMYTQDLAQSERTIHISSSFGR